MKSISTGKGTVSLLVLLGIWSVSALTSLPGLAISPISEKLTTIFPMASQLDIQLLTTLPSMLIVPFILLAGYLSERIGDIKLLYIGLSLFLLCGALCFVCQNITQLIIVSAMLGVGAGVIVPLSTSLVSRFFSGEQRTRQYGNVSAINNLSLVVATALVGWLADIQWRLPFIVYLLPLFSLLLVPAISSGERGIKDDVVAVAEKNGSVSYCRLFKYMLYYLLITYLVMVVSIDLPFLLGSYGYDSGVSGMLISLFFLAIMLPGLFINRILAVLGHSVLLWALLLIGLGLLDIYLYDSILAVIIGCVATGFGYGMAQPYVYDVTASLASASKVTYVFSLLMTMNYVAIVASPFITDGIQHISGVKGEHFPFLLNAVAALCALVLLLVMRYIRK